MIPEEIHSDEPFVEKPKSADHSLLGEHIEVIVVKRREERLAVTLVRPSRLSRIALDSPKVE